MSSMLIGCDGLPGHSSVLLCNISLHVESAVLMVLTWHSINPFDLG